MTPKPRLMTWGVVPLLAGEPVAYDFVGSSKTGGVGTSKYVRGKSTTGAFVTLDVAEASLLYSDFPLTSVCSCQQYPMIPRYWWIAYARNTEPRLTRLVRPQATVCGCSCGGCRYSRHEESAADANS